MSRRGDRKGDIRYVRRLTTDGLSKGNTKKNRTANRRNEPTVAYMWAFLAKTGMVRELRTTLYGYTVAYPWLPWVVPFIIWTTLSTIRLTLDTLRVAIPFEPSVNRILFMAAGNAFLSVPLFGWPVAARSGSLLAYAALHAASYLHLLNLCNAVVLGMSMEVAMGAINLSLIAWTACIALWLHPVWLRSEWPELQLRLYQLYAMTLPLMTVPQVIALVIATSTQSLRFD